MSVRPVTYWNREKNCEETEKIYGDSVLRALYGNRIGQFLADWVISERFVSALYGKYQSSAMSQHKIDLFVRDFDIRMDDFEDGPFRSFNDFFIRKFKDGKRPFRSGAATLPAFAEARYLAFEKISPHQTYPVKGKWLSPIRLLGSDERAEPFVGGPMLIARLCPVDYHRFHYPDEGETLEQYSIRGHFHSVNPLALRYRGDIFVSNERTVSILRTENFGDLAYIEVGALCVGRIVQTHTPLVPFHRGEEKGYFLFGGSTVILMGRPGRWRPSADLLTQTAQQRETFVKLGEPVGEKTEKFTRLPS